jgi:hypothetical protein
MDNVPGRVCIAEGVSCTCTENPVDAGAAPAADAGASDANVPPAEIGLFVGRWSPISGSGQANCNGQVTSLPPDPGAVMTLTQDGPNTLTATSSGAAGCPLELLVSGRTASLARSTETCTTPAGVEVFSYFNLVFIPAAGTIDGGGDAAGEGGPSVDAATNDGSGADAQSAGDDAGADASPPAGTLDWLLEDGQGSCVATLHYTFARAQ